jgi:hypothetical protein
MKLYLSGPMTDQPDYNHPAFHQAAAKLREMGHEVLSPAEDEYGAPRSLSVEANDNWIALMRRAIPMLCSCEAMVQIGNWWDSRGAKLEFEVARGLEMQVYSIIEPAADDSLPFLWKTA